MTLQERRSSKHIIMCIILRVVSCMVTWRSDKHAPLVFKMIKMIKICQSLRWKSLTTKVHSSPTSSGLHYKIPVSHFGGQT